ncbi:spore cortex-lytic enzyme [Anaerotignum sp.]|uniref:spore cortex-lytic enzyme n=1 Tax=Anaerotignum sp. TaxID=2039241 RepID=UPI0028AEF81D|nr:spore cortex-lytic enzyme [Anaerotignum sp.]
MKVWGKGVAWCCMLALSLCLFGHTVQSFEPQAQTVAQLVTWGTRGELVQQTQQRLKDLGFYRGTVDGIFGEKTYEAILEFQEANNLTPDGIAGDATLNALGIITGQPSEGGNLENLGEEELMLLASIIHGEARGEPHEGQVAVGAVVLNRVESPNFPNTIADVIYQEGAFDAVRDKQFYLTPNEASIQAAKDALSGWDPVEGALYYWNPATATSRWIWSIPITHTIGRHVFGKK